MKQILNLVVLVLILILLNNILNRDNVPNEQFSSLDKTIADRYGNKIIIGAGKKLLVLDMSGKSINTIQLVSNPTNMLKGPNNTFYLSLQQINHNILKLPIDYLNPFSTISSTINSKNIINAYGSFPIITNFGVIKNNTYLGIVNPFQNIQNNSVCIVYNIFINQKYIISIKELLEAVGLSMLPLKCNQKRNIIDVNFHDDKVYIVSEAYEIIFSAELGFKTFENIQIAYRFNSALTCLNSNYNIGPTKILLYYKFAYVLTNNDNKLYSFFNNDGKFSEINKIDLNHFNDSKKLGTIRHYSNVLTGENFILISNGGRIEFLQFNKMELCL